MMRLRHFQQDGGEGNRPADPPEVELWSEVVQQAVYDLRLWFNQCIYDRKAARKAARWLFSPIHQGDFYTVCDWAQVCPHQTRERARRVWMEKIDSDEVAQRVAAEIWEKEVTKC